MIKIGIVMDPIESINPKKDSTLAMMLAAQKRGWEIHYIQAAELSIQQDVAYANSRIVTVQDNLDHWFDAGKKQTLALHTLNVILMRVDPPVTQDYIYTTQILELAEQRGSLVVNKPASLRDINEKLFISQFTEFCTPTLVSKQQQDLRHFLQTHKDIILKPLDGMGGASIFRLREGDSNTGVILETITQHGSTLAMAQRYIPEINEGDKRILMINGDPIPYALARIPIAGENRGNLAAGGTGVGRELSPRDYEICNAIGPVLKEKGVLFAGIDVIGDYLTEINVTSPTCIRELDEFYTLDIAGQLLDCIQQKIK